MGINENTTINDTQEVIGMEEDLAIRLGVKGFSHRINDILNDGFNALN